MTLVPASGAQAESTALSAISLQKSHSQKGCHSEIDV